MTDDAAKEAAAFAAEVGSLRKRFESAKKTGVLTEALKEKAEQLSLWQDRLLTQALPVYRRYHLNDADCGAYLTHVLDRLDDLAESDLSAQEKMLCEKLADGESGLDLPDIPDAVGFDAGNYEGETFYLCARSGETAFVFGDGGDVLLFEKNLGSWQCRIRPVLTECFADGAVMESSSSCLVRNLDGGVDRIAYRRMEDIRSLARAPLFEAALQREESGFGK